MTNCKLKNARNLMISSFKQDLEIENPTRKGGANGSIKNNKKKITISM